MSATCLDENVCLQTMQKYFSYNGWAALLDVVEALRKCRVWLCGRCIATNSISYDTKISIGFYSITLSVLDLNRVLS